MHIEFDIVYIYVFIFLRTVAYLHERIKGLLQNSAGVVSVQNYAMCSCT